MTDQFEQAMQNIAIKSAANGGPTTGDILTCLQATNDDLDAKHEEEKLWHEDIKRLLDKHIVESGLRDQRLDVLEDWRREQVINCEEQVRKIVAPLLAQNVQDHKDFHNTHLAEDHPNRRAEDEQDADYTEMRQRTFFMWTIGSKLSWVFLSLLILVTMFVVEWVASVLGWR